MAVAATQVSFGPSALCLLRSTMLGLVTSSFGFSATKSLDTSVTLEHLDFDRYLSHHGKSYSTTAYATRKAIFQKNKDLVLKHNALYRAGEESWYAALNHLADYTTEEFQALRATKYDPSPFTVQGYSYSGNNPASVDWRTKNVVTPVKNQGGCGSCWAFSATETVESQYAIASGKLLTLAPQTYVDCVENPNSCGGTGGCEGATMELAFNLTAKKGIALESDLPYKGRDATCPTYTPAVKATG